MTIHWPPILGLGAVKRGVIGFIKLPIFDLRLLGAIAAALITLAMLPNLNSVQRCPPARIARGERWVQISSLALSPTGEQLATTNTAGRVVLRAHEKGWQIERSLDFPGYARSVAFSPDGRSLAAAGDAPDVCLWDLTSSASEPIRTMPVLIEPATRVLFSPDGQSLAVATASEGAVRLWNLVTRRERMVLYHPSPVLSIAFSPDGRRIATGGRDDSSILLWDLESGSRRALVEDEPGYERAIRFVAALAFSPNGALLASANFHEHSIRLWDLNARQEFRVFSGHRLPVNSVAFSPDGSLLATASNDGTLGLWTVATGQRLLSLDGQALVLRTVSFSADGRTLVLATGDDDDVRSWDLAELLRASPGPNSSPLHSGSIQLSRR